MWCDIIRSSSWTRNSIIIENDKEADNDAAADGEGNDDEIEAEDEVAEEEEDEPEEDEDDAGSDWSESNKKKKPTPKKKPQSSRSSKPRYVIVHQYLLLLHYACVCLAVHWKTVRKSFASSYKRRCLTVDNISKVLEILWICFLLCRGAVCDRVQAKINLYVMNTWLS